MAGAWQPGLNLVKGRGPIASLSRAMFTVRKAQRLCESQGSSDGVGSVHKELHLMPEHSRLATLGVPFQGAAVALGECSVDRPINHSFRTVLNTNPITALRSI